MSSGSLRSKSADVDAGKVAEVNGACHSHCPEASPSLSSSTLISSPSFRSVIFCDTRPKPAYGRQGLDWIVGPGYSFAVFSTVGQSDHFS